MRKKWRVMLVLLFALLFFAGCGTQTPDDDEEENYAIQVEVPETLADYVVPWRIDAPAQAKAEGTMQFYFLSDEGMCGGKWGDCCLIIMPDGKTMLIDGGVKAFAPLLLKDLECLGVNRIDYLVLSHCHSDHIGGIYQEGGLLDHVEVGQAYYSGVYPGYLKNPRELDEKLDSKGIAYQYIKQGDVLEFGEVCMTVLWPAAEEVGATYKTDPDLNNTSLVFRLDYKETSALFTGDIYVEAEEGLVRSCGEALDVDILKIPHHGQRTSSSESFAAVVSPRIAVAMGRQTMATDIYANYTKTGAQVFMDICDSSICVVSDGTTVSAEPAKERTTKHYDAYEYQA